MKRILYLLRSEPGRRAAELIEASADRNEVAVISLYRDEISGSSVDWSRLVDDIFRYDQVICW